MDLGAVAFRGTTRFRLVRFLGRGGMGVVYEAFDETNAVPVALKLLPVVSPDMLLRFKREFRAVADVRHPNLVRLGELVSEGSQWFFSMELVQGIDLMSYVRGVEPPARTSMAPVLASDAPTPIVMPGEAVRRYDPSSGLPLGAPPGGNYREERLRPALAQLARALAALHAAGAVHRDVKPSNVLVTAEGRAVLLDFGLVSAASIETTQSGAGTPEYMAPEQVAMQPVSGAADWYAFGVILFELLSGRLPFEGLPHEILYRKQHGRAPRVAALAPGVPADLAALCDRLLEADPEMRASGPEALAALAPAPVGRAIDPPPPRATTPSASSAASASSTRWRRRSTPSGRGTERASSSCAASRAWGNRRWCGPSSRPAWRRTRGRRRSCSPPAATSESWCRSRRSTAWSTSSPAFCGSSTPTRSRASSPIGRRSSCRPSRSSGGSRSSPTRRTSTSGPTRARSGPRCSSSFVSFCARSGSGRRSSPTSTICSGPTPTRWRCCRRCCARRTRRGSCLLGTLRTQAAGDPAGRFSGGRRPRRGAGALEPCG